MERLERLEFIIAQVLSLDAALKTETRNMNTILNNAGVDSSENLEQPADKFRYYEAYRNWTKVKTFYDKMQELANGIHTYYEKHQEVGEKT